MAYRMFAGRYDRDRSWRPALGTRHPPPDVDLDAGARFLLQLSGAYGHALYANKPAKRLADPPRLVPRTVPVIAALRAAGGSKDRAYDDLVVIDEVGRCLGVVRVADLPGDLHEQRSGSGGQDT
jgi:hypothetical protein